MQFLLKIIVLSLCCLLPVFAETKASLAEALKKSLDGEGIEATIRLNAHVDAEDYAIDETEFHAFAYGYLTEGKLPEARVAFELYVVRFPNSAFARDGYGEVLILLGDVENATVQYRQAIAVDPSNRNALSAIAELGKPNGLETLQARARMNNLLQRVAMMKDGARIAALPGLEEALTAFMARYPKSRTVAGFADMYLRILEETDLKMAMRAWQSFASHEIGAVAALATARKPLETLIEEPLDLKFTSVDGREVDFAALRGKVVLIDFWATWCGPCIAEIPNVKAVYEKYRSQGFEVIGITLERAQDKRKLMDFCEKAGVVWPNYFDGMYSKNPIAVRFGVRAIPAVFLLDKTGRLAATSVHGPRLDALVRQHLGQP